jgi:hypothetical protein
MRKSIWLTAAALAGGVAWNSAEAATDMYITMLNGKNEVPAVTTEGNGSGQIIVDPATKQARWMLSFQNLSGPATGAHIHCGAADGANAGVAINLGTNLKSPVNGSGTLTDAQLADLAAGKCYFNIHTDAHKDGELRGQLEKAPF